MYIDSRWREDLNRSMRRVYLKNHDILSNFSDIDSSNLESIPEPTNDLARSENDPSTLVFIYIVVAEVREWS